jgi:rhamnose utilization protein RhaD (predicted bifunctional aldolase and dehydrogenase)
MVTAVAEPAGPTAAPDAATEPEGWSEAGAAATAAAEDDPRLGRCLYVSRLLGARADLVLHGAGNTSVKSSLRGADGALREMIWVKGSGHDLAAVGRRSFTPVALAPLGGLTSVPGRDEAALTAALGRAMLDRAAPSPSVETLTHAILPHRYVLHAHPDAVLAATSVPRAAAVARRLFGPAYRVIPWAAPGLDLARAVDRLWRRHPSETLRGIVLLHHGVLTFAEDARDAWEAMLDCVARASAALPPSERRWRGGVGAAWNAADIATLRAEVSRLAGRPMVVRLDDSDEARGFAALPLAAQLVERGPLSACNVLRTKRTAALVSSPAAIPAALARFARGYRAYFRRFSRGRPLAMHDAAPRVVVAPGAGVFCCGRTAAEATAVRDLWRHTMPAMLAAERLGGYRPLDARQLFELEYGALDGSYRGGGPPPRPDEPAPGEA